MDGRSFYDDLLFTFLYCNRKGAQEQDSHIFIKPIFGLDLLRVVGGADMGGDAIVGCFDVDGVV